jgi:hypothetical protein
MLRFRRMLSLQKFAAVHASVHNHFNAERHLIQPIELQAEPRRRPNKGSGHLVVARHDVIQTLQGLAKFDHSVLVLNRTTHEGDGFTTEYVLQQQILSKWKQTPWADRYDVVQDGFPVDDGLTSRRIDILARDRTTGDWLVIELKRAEANIAAVHQVSEYMLALGKRDDFSHGRLDGVLVAERVSSAVRGVAANEGVSVYEASWPFTFVQMV